MDAINYVYLSESYPDKCGLYSVAGKSRMFQSHAARILCINVAPDGMYLNSMKLRFLLYFPCEKSCHITPDATRFTFLRIFIFVVQNSPYEIRHDRISIEGIYFCVSFLELSGSVNIRTNQSLAPCESRILYVLFIDFQWT